MARSLTIVPSHSNLMNLDNASVTTLCAAVLVMVKACHAFKSTRGNVNVNRKQATMIAAIAKYDRASVITLSAVTVESFKVYRASVVQRMKDASEVFACADPAATVAMIDRCVAFVDLFHKQSLKDCLVATLVSAEAKLK